jgi:hypothetical protein
MAATAAPGRRKGQIMIEISEPTTAAIVARYLAVWNEPDAEARRATIAELWAPDATEFVEANRWQGHEELEDRVAGAYNEFVATGRFTVTGAGDVTRHDDIITFTSQLTTPDGVVGWAARVFLLLGDDGLIKQDYHLTVKALDA